MELNGRVIKKLYAVGTKSEREAVMLETAEETYILRRLGGNAFQDSALEALVGSMILATGDLHGTTFIMRSWQTTKDSPMEGPSV
jgi:hypothetical protein